MKLGIMSGAYSLTSEITVDDILLLKQYEPNSLCIKNDKGDVKFAIGYADGCPCVSKFGITFGTKSLTDGKASVTELLSPDLDTAEKAKDYVAEKFGGIVAYLDELERSVPAAAEAIRDKKQELINSITVA